MSCLVSSGYFPIPGCSLNISLSCLFHTLKPGKKIPHHFAGFKGKAERSSGHYAAF
jgi:hypothetical protein